MTDEVRAYIQRHDLDTLFKDLLAALVRHRPERPFEYAAVQLQKMQKKVDSGLKLDFKEELNSYTDPSSTTNSAFHSTVSLTQLSEPRIEKAGSDNFSQHSTKSIRKDSDVNMPPTKPITPQPDRLGVKANLSRRCSVSAESYQPRLDQNERRVVISKSNEARMRIAAATTNNLLFRNLEADQRRQVVDAMFEKKLSKGETVIQQGDEGDNFYVVDEGVFEVLINGKKIVDVGPGGSFGELALMYNTPRAATVKAASDGILWGVDRGTFRRVVTDNMFRKRKEYEDFLRSVPLLALLHPNELCKVADALEIVEYEDGDIIIEQGDRGELFYILVEGEAEVTKQLNEDDEPELVSRLRRGGYFGELALLTMEPRAATVIAKGPVKCVCLEARAFSRLLGPCMDILKRNATAYDKYKTMIKPNE